MNRHPAGRGPRYRQLPLWRDARRLLVEVEQAVRAFPRRHKYTLGVELRRQANSFRRDAVMSPAPPGGIAAGSRLTAETLP